MIDFNKPLNEIIDVSELARDLGFSVTSSGVILAPSHDGHRKYEREIQRLQEMKEGKIKLGDVLGMFEHQKPVLQESFLGGVNLEEVVAGTMRLGIGFPNALPDYPLLPILYAINMLGKEDTSKNNGEKPVLTYDSCMGHVRVVPIRDYFDDSHDNHGHSAGHFMQGHYSRQRPTLKALARKYIGEQTKKILTSMFERTKYHYIVVPELHDSCLSLYDPREEGTERQRIHDALKEALTDQERQGMLKIRSPEEQYDRRYTSILPKRWQSLSRTYPRITSEEALEVAAEPIVDAVLQTWTGVINAVNAVAKGTGREELIISSRLLPVIADYSLKSRYNCLAQQR